VEVCKEQAEWARAEKRTFLRQRIELRLAALYLQLQDYPTALAILGT
jgi:26S proteasome regulatory subunit N6